MYTGSMMKRYNEENKKYSMQGIKIFIIIITTERGRKR